MVKKEKAMNKYIYIIGVLLSTWTLPMFSQVSNDNEDEVNKVDTRFANNDFVPGQVLVKFKDANRVQIRRSQGQFASTNVDQVTSVLHKYGISDMEQLLPNEKPNRQLRRAKAYNGDVILEHDLSQLYCVTLTTDHQHETMQIVEELKTLNEVEFAEPNYRVYMMADTHIADDYSGNPMENQQWYLDSYGVKELWNKPIINKARPIIAILDTGVDLTHPDLKDNLWTNTIEEYGIKDNDNDGNGFKNDVHGWDFVNNSANIRDNNMHGTHVAGITAAANNGIGIIGANPQALLMPITVLQSDGAGDVATIIKGINYAVANGATVLNMSLGTYFNSHALRQALENAYQKAVLVAAAGNDNKCIYESHYIKEPSPQPCFPAAYSFVLGVQATVKGGSVAPYSNYDDDGALFSCESSFFDPDGFNYELKVPGSSILSTIPGGSYKKLNGTSMAAPLAAGAISALKMVKQYDRQEILWGDLLHTNNIAEAYSLTSRPAELDMQKIILRERKDLAELDEDDYGGDKEVDAGETISIYPVIRTTFGVANNIKLKLMVDEFEDPDAVEIISKEVDFGIRLDAYAKAVSINPLILKIPNNIADARHIRLKVVATCDEMTEEANLPFTLVAHNMIKINGLINENTILTADHIYYVNGNLGINKGVTLTIEPGTRLEFAAGVQLASFGKLVAKGTPANPIVFTKHTGESTWNGISTHSLDGNPRHPSDTLSFCIIDNCDMSSISCIPYMIDCVLKNFGGWNGGWGAISKTNGERSLVTSCLVRLSDPDPKYTSSGMMTHTNIVNNELYGNDLYYRYLIENNFFNNFLVKSGNSYSHPFVSTWPEFDHAVSPSYIGSGNKELIFKNIEDYRGDWWGSVDLSNMPIEPIKGTHGIVWKVVVNGRDAQDEFEEMPPLGVGKHKFEVYFNRPMNKAVAPQISFGIRDPFTQHGVAEDGYWNDEGTIYTAYKTITGKTMSDGLNRIYVQGAEDDEFFPCPYEKNRFNVIVQAAGSMATGFMAEAGLGRVDLSWSNENNHSEDAMGFNIYRYHQTTLPAGYRNGRWHDTEVVTDTVRLNEGILDIETTTYTDYDVIPGEMYHYFYKVLGTDLQEWDVSNVVAVMPLTSVRGDANASSNVDVADVITTVNYITKQNPQPFIFEAADVNEDNMIDILDVMGIVKGILNPSLFTSAVTEGSAIYTIEDGILYVESDVALGGVQVQLTLDGRGKKEDVRATEELDGFEQASTWLSDNDYLFLAYSMNGKTLAPGKHALLYVGDSEISSLRLSDTTGKNVIVGNGDGTTGIDRMGKHVMNISGVYDLQGRKLSTVNSQVSTLKGGIYIINGKKVVK